MNCQTVCSCNGYPGNTAVGCIQDMGVGLRPWITQMNGADGTPNYIDLTTPLTDTLIKGFINNTDPTKRFYPYPEIKDIEDVRDKVVTEAAKDQVEYFVRYGLRKFTGTYFSDYACPALDGLINNLRCSNTLGAFWVDLNGTIWGNLSSDGTKLYPVRIDPQSVSSTFVKPTNTTVTKLIWMFNYHPTQKDCTLAGLPTTSMASGVDPLSYNGLFNIFLIAVSAVHTDTIVVKLNDGWGNITAPEHVTGFGGANKTYWDVYDITTSTDLSTPTTVVENVNIPGEYTITTSANFALGDNLKITITAPGYDGTAASQVVLIAT